jgi:hypothetical protein
MNETNNQLSADRSIIALGAKGIQLTNFEELFRFSTFVYKAGFAPRGMDSPEKIFLAVQMGLEVGISPMMALQNVGVINGRPGFYGELVVAIIQSHPSFEDMTTQYEGDGDEYRCSVTINRRGRTPSVGTFTIAQAKEADLLNNPSKKDTWGKYTDDMLYWRAFTRAKRIFADVLRGFRTVEDLRDQPAELPVTGRVVEPNLGNGGEPTQQSESAEQREERVKRHRRTKLEMEAARSQESVGMKPGPGDVIKPAATNSVENGTKLVDPPADPDPGAEIVLRLKEAGIPQEKFLTLLIGLGLIEVEPTDISAGYYTLGHVDKRTLQIALEDWDRVTKTLKGAVAV